MRVLRRPTLIMSNIT